MKICYRCDQEFEPKFFLCPICFPDFDQNTPKTPRNAAETGDLGQRYIKISEEQFDMIAVGLEVIKNSAITTLHILSQYCNQSENSPMQDDSQSKSTENS